MANLIVGTSGQELLYGTEGDDIIRSMGGGDRIHAGGGDDVVFGGRDASVFDGAGSDTCFGGQINADVTDADGMDLYVVKVIYYQPTTSVVFIDLAEGIAHGEDIGVDKLVGVTEILSSEGDHVFLGSQRSESFLNQSHEMTQTYSNTILTFGGNDVVNLHNVGKNIVNTGNGDDEIWFLSGNNSINAGSGDDIVYKSDEMLEHSQSSIVFGGSGDDYITVRGGKSLQIYGGSGNDFILGDFENATLYGGSGDDRITAPGVRNVLHGGDGADIFSFHELDRGEDIVTRIVDFEDGVDKLSVPHLIDQIELYGRDTANGLIVSLGDGFGKLFLRGVSLAQIGADDFILA